MSESKSSIYLDHAATTVLDPEVRRVVKQYLDRPINANPSSRHKFGLDMQQTIRTSKHQIASLLGITSFHEKNIVFTSGATEANNLIVFGHCLRNQKFGKHIVLGPTEHDCVREAVFSLSKQHGFTYTQSKLLPNGQLDLGHLGTILQPQTILVCQMAVSNIFGTIYDVENVAKLMKMKCPNALLHVDSVQAIGKIPFKLPILSSHIPTSISLSAHKIHGPKGIGLVAFDHPKSDVVLNTQPIVFGGGQEHGTRPGTENLLGIVAIAKSLSRAMMELGTSQMIFNKLHSLFIRRLGVLIPNEIAWVIPEEKTHHAILSIVTPTIPSEVVFNHLVQNRVYASVGSACQAREKKISPSFLSRFPEQPALARHILRISFSRFSTTSEVERCCNILSKILPPLHQSSPLRKRTEKKENNNVVPPPPPQEKKEKTSEGEEDEEEGEEMPTKNLSGKKRKKAGRIRKKFVADDFSQHQFSRILCRVGELALKKKNRKIFERQLGKNIGIAIRPICPCQVETRDRRLYVTPRRPEDRVLIPRIANRLTKVFGLTSLSLCFRVQNDMKVISEVVKKLAKRKLDSTTHQIKFRVSTKRANKQFSLKSMEVSQALGKMVGGMSPRFKVDLKNADYDIGVDIRGEGTYIYTEKISCEGGLPVGTTGKGVTLLSGGIDSPVASWMMMKRGMSVNYVSFFSYPYTSESYVDKIKKIGEKLAQYQQPDARMFFVPLTKIQEAIRDNCQPEGYRTVLYRRAMNRLGLMVARKIHAKCLITGESLGQVASQTIPNITSIMQPVGNEMPIFRPLIGMDKGEIMEIARRIGTVELSNLEAADTCTLFKPKAPVIYSKLHLAEAAEKMVPNYQELLKEAVKEMKVLKLKCNMFEVEQEEEEEEEEVRKLQPAEKKRKLDDE